MEIVLYLRMALTHVDATATYRAQCFSALLAYKTRSNHAAKEVQCRTVL